MQEMMNSVAKDLELVDLTKEQFRQQFLEQAKQHSHLKHMFSIDEAYDWLQLQRARRMVWEVQQRILNTKDCFIAPDDNSNPVKHMFGDGCVVREIYIPPNELIVTHIHKFPPRFSS